MSLPSPARPGGTRIQSRPCPPLPPEDLADILGQTRALWEEMRGHTLFITGATGFFGIWLLESFAYANDHLQLGARALVLSRNPAAFKARVPHLSGRTDLEFLSGDLLDFTFPPGHFTFVIHAANNSDTSNSAEPEDVLDAVIRGTDRLLEFVAQAGTKKLLLTSSGAVYGRQPPALQYIAEDYASEHDPLTADIIYMLGKRASEKRCTDHARKFGYEAKIARCFAFVGPHLPLDREFAAGNFIRNALLREPVQVSGDGTPYRSYLYAADLTIWLWTILFRGQSTRPYNVGSDQALTIAELAKKVSAASGNPTTPAVVFARQPSPGATASRYVPAIDRARTELSLIPRVSLETALQRTIQWYRSLFT